MSWLIIVVVMQPPAADISGALKYFWLGLPPEVWIMIVGQLPLRDAAVFSLACKTALQVFLNNAHWKDRWWCLGRTFEADADPRAAFRAAVQSSFVLWVDRARKVVEILESHEGSPEQKGMFPVLRLGPLGDAHPHDFIMGSVFAMSRVELCEPHRPQRPYSFYLTDTVKPKQMMRAMLIVGSRLGIKVTKIPFIFNNNPVGGAVEFSGWNSISINSTAWDGFMGVSRSVCKEIDRTLGIAIVSKNCDEYHFLHSNG